MIQTVVIAAAGRGTRIQSVNSNLPKHLLPINGKPFFQYVLALVRAAGFEQVVVIVGHHAEKMRVFLSDEAPDAIVVDQKERVGDRYGSASVVEAASEAVGMKPFVFMNGDSLFTSEVFEAVRSDDGLYHMIGAAHENPSRYGVVESTDDGFLKRIIEKPQQPTSSMINVGIYGFRPEIFELAAAVPASPRGEFEITDVLNELAKKQQVRVHEMNGEWIDLGRPEDIAQVEAFVQRNNLN